MRPHVYLAALNPARAPRRRSGVCRISSIYERGRSSVEFPRPAPVNLDLKGTFYRSDWRFAATEMLVWIIGGKPFPAVWETRRAESPFRHSAAVGKFVTNVARAVVVYPSHVYADRVFFFSDCQSREAFCLVLITRFSILAENSLRGKKKERERGENGDPFEEYSDRNLHNRGESAETCTLLVQILVACSSRAGNASFPSALSFSLDLSRDRGLDLRRFSRDAARDADVRSSYHPFAPRRCPPFSGGRGYAGGN